jgi:hypothetical protein
MPKTNNKSLHQQSLSNHIHIQKISILSTNLTLITIPKTLTNSYILLSKHLKNKSSLWWLWVTVLFLLNLSKILSPFIKGDFTYVLNFNDDATFWNSLDSFIHGKVIYRDYIWDYGLLYVILASPFYLLFNQSFLSVILIKEIFFPLLSIIISIVIGKLFFKNYKLLFFLTLLCIFYVNNSFISLRYLIPELGLALFIIALKTKNLKKSYLASFIIGISFLGALEYAIASLFSSAIALLIFSSKKFPFSKNQIIKLITLSTSIPLIYFFLLYSQNALKPFFEFYSQISNSFIASSPNPTLFPRLSQLDAIFNSNSSNFSQNLQIFLQSLNFYLIPLFCLFLIFKLIFKKNNTSLNYLIPFLLYYLLTYYRIIVTPDVLRLQYNFTLFFVALLIFHKYLPKKLSFTLITWIFLTSHFLSNQNHLFNLFKIPQKNDTQSASTQKTILPVSKAYSQDLSAILDYIGKNTKPSDSIYSYPSGSYHLLSKRKYNYTSPTACYDFLVPSLAKKTLEQFNTNTPALIILNTTNGITCQFGLTLKYKYHSQANNLFIEGPLSPLEEFITKNYEIALKTKYAWVLKPARNTPNNQSLFTPIQTEWNINYQNVKLISNQTHNTFTFQTQNNKPIITFQSKNLNNAYIGKITLKLNNYLKPLTRYRWGLFFETSLGNEIITNGLFTSGDWQDLWFYIPSFKDRYRQTNSVSLILSPNYGFLPIGEKLEIQIKQIEIFTPNTNLEIDDTQTQDT